LFLERSLGKHYLANKSAFSALGQKMIDRFYAAPLMGEMAIQELLAKRRPRPWER